MNDLERVREWLHERRLNLWVDYLDAHERRDAAREDTILDATAELNRQHEELAELRKYIEAEARDHESHHTQLAKLRDKDESGYMWAFHDEQERANKAEAELARLRKAAKAVFLNPLDADAMLALGNVLKELDSS